MRTAFPSPRGLWAVIAIVVLLGITAALYGIQPYESANIFDYSNEDREAAKIYFMYRIGSVGAREAYKEFAASMRSVPVDRQHVFAHVFGEALYDSDGIEGFKTCDLQFMYGCFHELMGRAITENGLEIVPDIYDICTHTPDPRPFACLHGIGHGIIASLGYTSGELGAALGACDSIVDSELVYWCHSGVFMEYNQQSMLGTSFVRDPEAEESIYEPCGDLQDEYQQPCLFEQPQWWHRALFGGDNTPETFSKLGEFCERGGLSPLLVRTCFEGVGNITSPTAGYNPDQTRSLCEASSRDPLNQLFCKSMAALSFSSALHDAGAAEKVCAELEDEGFAFCSAYAHNEATLMRPLPAPRL